MTTRNFVDKNGNSWSWEETEEVKKAIEQLHKINETQNDTTPTNVG